MLLLSDSLRSAERRWGKWMELEVHKEFTGHLGQGEKIDLLTGRVKTLGELGPGG